MVPSLSTTQLSNDGQTVVGKYTPPKLRHPGIDCFYVYPTVSDDKSDNSDLSIDPEERSIALYQAARYSQDAGYSRPMYRQVTITRLLQGPDTITPKMRKHRLPERAGGVEGLPRRTTTTAARSC